MVRPFTDCFRRGMTMIRQWSVVTDRLFNKEVNHGLAMISCHSMITVYKDS